MPNVYSAGYQFMLKQLRRARMAADLTQVQVARRFRKPQSFVSKVESGERRLDIAELEAFAKLYRKPLSYFHQ